MDLKKMIVIVGSIIFILVITLAILSLNGVFNKNKNLSQDEIDFKIVYNELSIVKNKDTFFTVKACAEKYIYEVYYKNKENIVDLLSEKYINDNKITKDNVLTKIDNYNNPQILDIDYMYELHNSEDVSTYYIVGTIRDDIYEEETTPINFNIAIKLDVITRTFSVTPNEPKPDENNLPNDKTKNINQNNNNTYESSYITEQSIGEMYFAKYVTLMQDNSDKAYEMLDETYRANRFQNKETFDKYIKGLGNYIYTLTPESVDIFDSNGTKIYTINDQLGNVYIFKERAIMNFTVELDDYTIENESSSKKYEEASLMNKGIINIGKFFEMINLKDYDNAYKVLDENFKSSKFPTEADFEKFVKSKLFEFNKVQNGDYKNTVMDIHQYSVYLTDGTEKSDNYIKINIVMKLLENGKFVMSFDTNIVGAARKVTDAQNFFDTEEEEISYNKRTIDSMSNS